MSKTCVLCLVILIMVFGFAYPSKGFSQNSVDHSAAVSEKEGIGYTFAFSPHSLLGLSSTEAMELLKPMIDQLGKDLNIPVKTRAIADSQAFLKSLEKGEIDIAIADIPLYLKARKHYGVIPVVRFKGKYRAVLVVLGSSRIKRIEDAKGKIFACSSRYSMSSYFFPKILLFKKGIVSPEHFFSSVKITGKDSQSLQMLFTRQVDITSLTEPTYYVITNRLPVLGALLRVVEKSPDYLFGPIFVREGMKEEEIKKISDFMINFKMDPKQKETFELYFSMAKIPSELLKLVAASSSDYKPFLKLILE